MPDGFFDLAADSAPIAAQLDSLGSDHELASKFSKLHQLQQRSEKAVREYRAELESLYEDIKRSGHTADWILEAAAIVRRREFIERERLGPGLDLLRKKLAIHPNPEDSETRQVLEQSIVTAEAWIVVPTGLQKKLLELATERQAAAQKIRHARPVEGAMEDTELTREIIARFPKILAELAK